MNRNLKFATVGVIIAAVMAFGVVATIGFIAPAHAQGNMTAGGNVSKGNMTAGNMTAGNMTGNMTIKK